MTNDELAFHIRAVADVISSGWCRHAEARKANNETTKWYYDDAVKFDLCSAIYRSTSTCAFNGAIEDRAKSHTLKAFIAQRLLTDSISKRVSMSWSLSEQLNFINDSYHTKQRLIKRLHSLAKKVEKENI